jgi:hypothetical protein
MKLRIETYRDNSGRLRARLFRDGRLVAVKPAERVCDGAPPEMRHQYNLFKVFGLYYPNMSREDAYRLLSGEEVEVKQNGV